MTVDEARKIAEREEKICKKCRCYVCGVCAVCRHNDHFAPIILEVDREPVHETDLRLSDFM